MASLISRKRLKSNRVVQLPALRTPRAIDVRIIGIDVMALFAPEDMVLALDGSEAPLPLPLIKRKQTERAQRGGDVEGDERIGRHGAGGRLVTPRVETGAVCQ